MEMKEKVMQSGHYLFDNKPMIVKSWTKDLELRKEDVKVVPAWIQIHNFPLKFWGKGLPKIAGIVGKFVKSDLAKEEKTRLGYARVMVELEVDQKLPAKIAFKDEKGFVIEVAIEYEWRPVKCKYCMGMGHEMEQCRRGVQEKPKSRHVKQVWRPVVKQASGNKVTVATTPVNKEVTVAVTPSKQISNTPRTVTPIKRLVRMQGQAAEKGGYSAEGFGAHSYRDIVTSPSKLNSRANETKTKNKSYSKVVNSFNNWCISTNSGYHKGGRIWILWQPNAFRIQFQEYNAQYIHMKVESVVNSSVFHLTMVYAFNGIHERAPLWDHLRRLAMHITGPWAIAGDFNCVLAATERVGGNTSLNEIEPLRRCVEDCGVVDIAAIGSLFTWNNKQRPEDRIYSRIDRFLVNKAWCDLLPDLYAHFLPEGMLDHTPCIVSCSKHTQGNRCFKYFNMWGGSKNFKPTVRESWDRTIAGTPMFKVAKNLKLLKLILKQLNREGFGDIENTTDILQKKVQELQEQLGKDPFNVQLMNDEYAASNELKEKDAARASFLSQKAKHQWVQQGDTNSSYFHGLLKKRRNGNKIVQIEDMNGKMCNSPDQIHTAFLDYYQYLIGTSQETKQIHKKIIVQGLKCNEEQCGYLLRPVTGKEIRDALFSIPDMKSPGPNGYTSRFFKDAWEVVREDIITIVQDFFQKGKLLKQINATTLTLIPKCDRPQNVLQYRPIACCNALYKVISKLLCARLAEVLPVEWAFVDQLLDMLMFPAGFKAMVMQCITTATFSLSINGDMFGYFNGKTGLRQGDPLSPLVFTLCMEYLTRTLKGDTESMMLLLKSFSTFSKASGLKRILSLSSFKCLGMPIQTTRLKKKDCECLVEKICSRINGYGARKFSYSGRLVLVQAVLSSLHSYWASMFVLPKEIIARIEATCRNFLWDNSADYIRVPLVAWDKVCRPKEEGGLGLKNRESMNKSMVGRLVNWIAEKKDTIWVNWLQQNYLKGTEWIDYIPAAQSSWVWRRICRVKQELLPGYTNG
ncbi:uncharacterized protein LOC141595221 [Silene latifolia]|uniref:uncharacterized protein LOC141595221 n=1 Tax=Silene latifolia TaxID=37657 RepID=UPI003D77A423